jgi:hypothetical protein
VSAWLSRVQPGLQPIARRLDRLLRQALPGAVCGVKWGVPFYGLPGIGWIAAVNSFQAHVKLVLFAGRSLRPPLPAGKGRNAIDFRTLAELDEKRIRGWLRQAKRIPGWQLKTFPGRTAPPRTRPSRRG